VIILAADNCSSIPSVGRFDAISRNEAESFLRLKVMTAQSTVTNVVSCTASGRPNCCYHVVSVELCRQKQKALKWRQLLRLIKNLLPIQLRPIRKKVTANFVSFNYNALC